MQLPQTYRSHVLSKGTLSTDDLTYRCLHFLQSGMVDRSLAELISHLEGQYREIVTTAADRREKLRETGDLLCNRIIPLLEAAAPKGTKFRFHPGDPGRLGFFQKRLFFEGSKN